MDFVTFSEAARRGPVKEYKLRQMQKAGILQGFFSGNRFYVNYPALLEWVKQESIKNGGGQTA